MAGKTTQAYRDELRQVEQRAKRYPAWATLPMLGAACASFAGMFGADLLGALLAGLGGGLGATTRHLLVKWHFKPFVYCLAAAFVASAVVLALSEATNTGDPAVAACVLFLVPGVPMLNGTSDLLNGHYLNGVVRLTMSSVIVLGSALGLVIALALWGAP